MWNTLFDVGLLYVMLKRFYYHLSSLTLQFISECTARSPVFVLADANAVKEEVCSPSQKPRLSQVYTPVEITPLATDSQLHSARRRLFSDIPRDPLAGMFEQFLLMSFKMVLADIWLQRIFTKMMQHH